jgi:SecD/SecF fusion protein
MEVFLKKHLGKIALIVLPIIAALILLFPTYNASRLEKKEKEAFARAEKAGNSVDSLKIMDDFYKMHGEDLANAKKNRLKLGLDLRGGMYVTMEVDIVKLIEESAQSESIDEIFMEVLDKTAKDVVNSEETAINIFLKNFDAIARPKGKTLLNYFETTDFRDISEKKIIDKLNENATQAIDQAQEVIRQRIDQYGVSEPNIQKSGARRIVLELPGVQNRSEMMHLLQTTARLEFKLVRNNENIVKAFSKIDKYLSRQAKGLKVEEEIDTTVVDTAAQKDVASAAEEKATDTETVADNTNLDTLQTDSADVAKDTSKKDPDNPYEGLSEEEARERYLADHPFTSLFSTFYFQGVGDQQQMVNFGYITDEVPEGEYMFRITKDSLNKFLFMLQRPDIKTFLPIDLEVAVDAKPDQRFLQQSNIEIFDFYALKREAELTGDVITDAKATFDPTTNAPVVSMSMSADGSESWARITGANLKKRIAIVLDGRVYSAPTVQNKITGGNSQITGMANTDEAHLLEIVLKAGALKAPVQIIEERIVGPSLGEDSIQSGLWASVIAVIFVVLFMIVYYSTAGVLADIAIMMNVLLILSVLAALNGTLTLPGIAGIILTVGMAIDANVLIFERIREELNRGRSIRSSVDDGFQKALSAILDSNITTFITGVILYYFGSGPIQGFALTLMIGILGTLFTGIVITKALIELSLAKSGSISFGLPKNLNNELKEIK